MRHRYWYCTISVTYFLSQIKYLVFVLLLYNTIKKTQAVQDPRHSRERGKKRDGETNLQTRKRTSKDRAIHELRQSRRQRQRGWQERCKDKGRERQRQRETKAKRAKTPQTKTQETDLRHLTDTKAFQDSSGYYQRFWWLSDGLPINERTTKKQRTYRG